MIPRHSLVLARRRFSKLSLALLRSTWIFFPLQDLLDVSQVKIKSYLAESSWVRRGELYSEIRFSHACFMGCLASFLILPSFACLTVSPFLPSLAHLIFQLLIHGNISRREKGTAKRLIWLTNRICFGFLAFFPRKFLLEDFSLRPGEI